MKVINIDNLVEQKFLGYGKYSYTTIVEYDNDFYCFKKFRVLFEDSNVINRLCHLTEEKFEYNFLVPLYMVQNNEGKIIGYLSKYYDFLLSMQEDLSFYERLELIKSAKEKIEILHNEYGRIHGDLHFKNILCDKNNLQSYLIDFDLSVRIGDLPCSFMDYTLAVQKYLNYYPFDFNVDIYHFNLCTLQYLAKYYDNWKLLLHNPNARFSIPGINKDVKKLSKELLLDNSRQPYSGKYIIDFVG